MWTMLVICFKLWLNIYLVTCALDADYDLLSSAESGDMVYGRSILVVCEFKKVFYSRRL